MLPLFLLLMTLSAWAHSGGTDANGCHAGTELYHCHGSKSAPSRPHRSYSSYSYEAPPSYSPPPKPSLVCQRPRFYDPEDDSYAYCANDSDYEVIKNGVWTGTAENGTTAYYAIRRLDPSSY